MSVNTIKRYPEYWDNARSVRAAYKKNKNKLGNIISISTLVRELEARERKLGILALYNIKRLPVSDAINIDKLFDIIDIKM
jgi:hypothetical protein